MNDNHGSQGCNVTERRDEATDEINLLHWP